MERRLSIIGWDAHVGYELLGFAPLGDGVSANVLRKQLSSLSPKSLIFQWKDMVLWLKRREPLPKSLSLLLDDAGWHGAAGGPYSDISKLSEQVSLVSRILEHSLHSKGLARLEDVAIDIARDKVGELGECFSHPAVGLLERHDSDNDSELLDTLRCYFSCESNIAATASMLGVHRNTVIYRMDRIRDIAGIDLASEDERMHLRLSFM